MRACFLPSQLGACRLLPTGSRHRLVDRNSAPQSSRLRSVKRRFTSAAVSAASGWGVDVMKSSSGFLAAAHAPPLRAARV
eukprot:CAMPEP_0119093538 /NCGR_PEP_ID=MMETSP1178-20130426/163452_1 /TAXON_ID=33656 /ORGANISM="unid sp, Strain CCMP2000" /LENGTH=79 /DNA_ID=CAMNT_0007077197 /DNA_START=309 /DNA_END=546 /DNA_ORIENTATION=-